MSSKTTSVLYWATTGLFGAFMLLSGVLELMQDKASIDAMASIGYPAHILITLGIAKLAGGIVLLLPPKMQLTLKEWTYAGFTFDLLGASIAIALSPMGILPALFPLSLFILLIPSYVLWKKKTGQAVTL